MEVFGFNDDLQGRRVVTMLFALLSGVSAVATAVVPAIINA